MAEPKGRTMIFGRVLNPYGQRQQLKPRTRQLLAGHARLAAQTGCPAYISGDTGAAHGPNRKAAR